MKRVAFQVFLIRSVRRSFSTDLETFHPRDIETLGELTASELGMRHVQALCDPVSALN